MARIEVWDSILRYLLAVNFVITQIKKEKDDKKVNFELLNPKIIPLNELSIETDPIYTFYRGYWLIDYFLNRPGFAVEIKNYFKAAYGIEPHHFIYDIMRIIVANSNKNPEDDFYYQVPEGEQDIFDKLSVRAPMQEIYKLLNIRKSPFIKVDRLKYILADSAFLFEKAYSQFLNDFWFDWLKEIIDDEGKPIYTITRYRGEFGYFFEQYLSKILKTTFEKYKHSVLLMFDQLKVQTGKGSIEIADVYFRNGNKIFLAQVKSGSIYDNEKFGGDVESLYKNDREKFFQNFGVNQLIESLTSMEIYIQTIDRKFPKGHFYEVFPCIIFNDKAFQIPLMADTFNNRFQEILKDFNVKKVKVNPLTLIHISDLEILELQLGNNTNEIWKLLHYSQQEKSFIPAFYDKINRKWTDRKFPDNAVELLVSLTEKYNPGDTKN